MLATAAVMTLNPLFLRHDLMIEMSRLEMAIENARHHGSANDAEAHLIASPGGSRRLGRPRLADGPQSSEAQSRMDGCRWRRLPAHFDGLAEVRSVYGVDDAQHDQPNGSALVFQQLSNILTVAGYHHQRPVTHA